VLLAGLSELRLRRIEALVKIRRDRLQSQDDSKGEGEVSKEDDKKDVSPAASPSKDTSAIFADCNLASDLTNDEAAAILQAGSIRRSQIENVTSRFTVTRH